ncbi:hypothetical protein DFQ14_10548 [Halopolyspora algeriensis]|uniref:Uncharacterized protein n=1 Tax=Halopolyspora algeriensis TaxID=1500506 RepID=A0A368VTL1_9ACTN|nr:hypothetical protein DFQ14_10548 [Halopolyspora algeriensis]TQM53590.1 hypothetical protein FHU43_1751 [Halopolyspora algeriensis]
MLGPLRPLWRSSQNTRLCAGRVSGRLPSFDTDFDEETDAPWHLRPGRSAQGVISRLLR